MEERSGNHTEKIEAEDTPQRIHAYNFKVFTCPTVEALQKVFDENKDKEGFYPYYIPQSEGCIMVIATKNPQAFIDTKPRIELGLRSLSEAEAQEICRQSSVIAFIQLHSDTLLSDEIGTLLAWLYDNGYELCKRVQQEASA